MNRAGYRLNTLALAMLGFVTQVQAQTPASKIGWELTLDDEFTDAELDTGNWKKRYKWGEAQVNGELQAYVDDAFTLDGEVLHIVGQHSPGQYAKQTFEYRSGLIASLLHQRYGWFEIRCRMPAGKGFWPAFWLLGENGTTGVNEIDIHEFLGNEPDVVHLGVHWGDSYSSGHESDGHEYQGPDFSADYHTFAVDWDADRVIWYVDGEERFRHTGIGVPQAEMYVIANLAIGGSWPGAPDVSTVFPSSYDIDYIRVYRKLSDADTPEADTPDAPDAGVGSADSGVVADDQVQPVPSQSSQGCGCHVAARNRADHPGGVFALLGLLSLGWSRRRGRPRTHQWHPVDRTCALALDNAPKTDSLEVAHGGARAPR